MTEQNYTTHTTKILNQDFATTNRSIQGVLAISGFEFRGFVICVFLKPSKCPHFVINPRFLELKMLECGYFFK